MYNHIDFSSLQKVCNPCRGFCSRTQRKHIRLAGVDQQNVFWTLRAQPYPWQLAAAVGSLVARALRDSWILARVRGAARAWTMLKHPKMLFRPWSHHHLIGCWTSKRIGMKVVPSGHRKMSGSECGFIGSVYRFLRSNKWAVMNVAVCSQETLVVIQPPPHHHRGELQELEQCSNIRRCCFDLGAIIIWLAVELLSELGWKSSHLATEKWAEVNADSYICPYPKRSKMRGIKIQVGFSQLDHQAALSSDKNSAPKFPPKMPVTWLFGCTQKTFVQQPFFQKDLILTKKYNQLKKKHIMFYSGTETSRVFFGYVKNRFGCFQK